MLYMEALVLATHNSAAIAARLGTRTTSDRPPYPRIVVWPIPTPYRGMALPPYRGMALPPYRGMAYPHIAVWPYPHIVV